MYATCVAPESGELKSMNTKITTNIHHMSLTNIIISVHDYPSNR